ncbi:hypothetical protein CMEL01_06596 [Colletotrichum melonis]|uniref:Fucose-specific lectin n=1 Tax=Colletotrichum melonis TaxID=1209925 RepID=A0AAI9U5D6_9PEZI|nr:hypothetical protein CMEL01_06596 [Colletotrichum melonis]
MSAFPANLAAVTFANSTHLYFIDSSTGRINYYKSEDPNENAKQAYHGPDTVTIQGADVNDQPVAPLAAQNNARLAVARFLRDDKEEVRLYYRSSQNRLMELCLSADGNGWRKGDLNEKNFALDSNGGIEAIATPDNKEIKVYCLGDGHTIPTVWYRFNDKWQSRLIK